MAARVGEREARVGEALLGEALLGETLIARLLAAARAERPDRALRDDVRALTTELAPLAPLPSKGEPYSRTSLVVRPELEVMLARWSPGARCAPHDHGGGGGFVLPLAGSFVERRFAWRGAELIVRSSERASPDGHEGGDALCVDTLSVDAALVHDMESLDEGLSLHVYTPSPRGMAVYDLARAERIDLVGSFGAWIPSGAHPRLPFERASRADVLWVGYTTHYRGGSAEFAVASRTLATELRAAHPSAQVILAPLRTKADFVEAMRGLARDGRRLKALHFVGHSGMYGVMFGSIAWPEQLSPHEWRALAAEGAPPFSEGAVAHFHACRTGRWFARFFAQTFGVEARGHHGYTTISARPDRFRWAGPHAASRERLYVISTPGRKSHGALGSLRKYAGARAEPMLAFSPEAASGARSYDAVADLYDEAFVDIRVRRAEWRWIDARARQATRELGRPLRILDLGCGNGALLRALDERGRVSLGVGLDDSEAMIAHARRRSEAHERLAFARIDGPRIELPDASVDVVVSFLSFRYLDWDPIVTEMSRVLAPGGRIWMVDMVEQPLRLGEPRELTRLVRDALGHWLAPRRQPRFREKLARLTSHPAWQAMLRENPIRAEHEYRWYFESRFPGRSLELLTLTPRQRVVAFDTGPLPEGGVPKLSFP